MHPVLKSDDEAAFPSINLGNGSIATWGRTTTSQVPSTVHTTLSGAKISKSHCSVWLSEDGSEVRRA